MILWRWKHSPQTGFSLPRVNLTSVLQLPARDGESQSRHGAPLLICSLCPCSCLFPSGYPRVPTALGGHVQRVSKNKSLHDGECCPPGATVSASRVTLQLGLFSLGRQVLSPPIQQKQMSVPSFRRLSTCLWLRKRQAVWTVCQKQSHLCHTVGGEGHCQPIICVKACAQSSRERTEATLFLVLSLSFVL